MTTMTYETNRVVRENAEIETVFEFDPPTGDEFVNRLFGFGLWKAVGANVAGSIGTKDNPMSEAQKIPVYRAEWDRILEARSMDKLSEGRQGGQRAAQPLPEVQEVLTQFALNRGKPASMWTKAAELLQFSEEGVWLKAADQRKRLNALIEDNTEIAQAKADVDAAADDEF
jgi:hypothetical protein